ncbi:MAG: metallophosphoesterase [Bacteroidales bacterium]|nr:metallophosphoesterase [Bacteroidales bacterium]
MKHTRRDFVKSSGLIFCGSGLFKTINLFAGNNPSSQKNNILKGFIVTDAHFGLVHAAQPSVEQQREAIRVIRQKFVDLDVFIDTGDSYHNGLNAESDHRAKGDWTKVLSNGCGNIPFYHTPGNHEVIHAAVGDPEEENNKITSATCRPYYSFDIKNIHFVSLPELLLDIYINEETIAWLKLDLELNKDKTIIFISHNSIKGTSAVARESIEPGEFGVINSRQLKNIFSKYPKVLAWMHGHTHTYNIVIENNITHVSCGRIGGIIPPASMGVGQEELGGVYFEIHPDKFIARCFSATANKFHDEMGFASLSKQLAVETSINASARPTYSYGMGGMNDGQKVPLYNHHCSTGKQDLYVMASETSAINDNASLSLYEEREVKTIGKRWMLMGVSVGHLKYFQAENDLWKWENPGIRLLKQDDSSEVDVCVPSYPVGECIYYKCAPNIKYKVSLNIESSVGGQKCIFQLELRDNRGHSLKTLKGHGFTINSGNHTYSEEFFVSNPPEITNIYTDSRSDNTLQLNVKATFTNIHEDVVIKNFNFKNSDALNLAENPKITINDKVYQYLGNISSAKPTKLAMVSVNKDRNILQCNVGGKRKLSWLIRQNNIDWQVRNASVSDKGNYLEIKAIRNICVPEKEVIIVPAQPIDKAFVYTIKNIEHCRIYPLNRGNSNLRIEVLDCNARGKIKIHSDLAPANVRGSANWKYTDSNLLIGINSPANIVIT